MSLEDDSPPPYDCNPSAARFHESNARVKALWGPIGCLSGDTLIPIRRGARNGGRLYTLRDAFKKQNGLHVPGKGNYQKWDDQPSYTLSLVDGAIVYAEIHAIVESGVKPTFLLTGESGRSIRATADHRFRVPEGTCGSDVEHMVRLASLAPGDTIIARNTLKTVPEKTGRTEGRRTAYSIPYHPYGWKNVVAGFDYKRMAYARLIVEANMNGWPVADFIMALRHDPDEAAKFKYLPPDQDVHHIDENVQNDRLDNLEVIPSVEHARQHSTERVAQHFGHCTPVGERIVSIEEYGEEETYDVMMKGTAHNFVANGFVVHNSGKSTSAGFEFFFQASESPIPIRGIVVRSSYRELHDTTRKTFFEWFGKCAVYRERDETAVLTIPGPGGKPQSHELMFRSIQKPEDTSKFLSLEIAFAWMEECVPAFMTNGVMGAGLPKGVIDILLMRLRQKGAHRYTLVLTANAPSKSHWFYKHLIGPSESTLAAKGWAQFFQPPMENKKNLPSGYYDELRSHLDPDLVRRFIEGEVLEAYDGEAVFPECSEKRHVVDHKIEPMRHVGLALGTDWGNVVSATLITQLTPDGRWSILREVISQNTAADQHIEEVKAVLANEFAGFEVTRAVGDPAGEGRAQTDAKTCFQIAASKGIDYETGAIDFGTRREAIKQRLTRNVRGEPAMVISREGAPTFAEGMLGAYRYPRSSDGRVGYKPIKNLFSHPCDAGQYIATRLFRIWTPQDPEYYQPRDGYIMLPPLDPFRPVQRRTMEGGDKSTWMSN